MTTGTLGEAKCGMVVKKDTIFCDKQVKAAIKKK